MSVPFMQLYIGDYLRDTHHLNAEQHGAYLLLLMAMWSNGGALPNDPSKLARFAHCTPTRWAKIGADVIEFFEWDGEVLTNKRLSLELAKASEKSSKRSNAGKLGVEAKALKNKETPQANGQPLPRHSSEPEPDITPSVSPNGEPSPSGDAKPKRSRKSTTPATKRCPESWEPNDAHRGLVQELRMSAVQARLALDTFRDHEFRVAKSDWNAAFSNWLRRDAGSNLTGAISHGRSGASPDLGLDRHQSRLDSFQRGAMAAIERRQARWGV